MDVLNRRCVIQSRDRTLDLRALWAAIQIHGGHDYIRDYAVERMYRDQRLCSIGEGTNEIQRLVIAREVLGP